MATRSEEIEREIEETRRDMTRTVSAIERRLSPDGMMDGAMSWLRDNPKGRALVDDVTEVVARNPLPVVLIGIGLGWLAWEIAGGGRRSAGRYRPMRDRLGPNFPAERHHMHVEDGGSSAYGGSPDPETLVGYRRGTESAAQAAEAFRDTDRGTGMGGNGGRSSTSGISTSGITGTGPYRPTGLRSGSTSFPRAGEPGGPGYGPSVTPAAPKPASNLGTTAGAAGSAGMTGTGSSVGSTGAGSTGAGMGALAGGGSSSTGAAGTSTGSATGSMSGTDSNSSSPDPQKLTGYNRSGEKASDAAKAFEPGGSSTGTTGSGTSTGMSTGTTGSTPSSTGRLATNTSDGTTGSGMSAGTVGLGTSTGNPASGTAGSSTSSSSSVDADKLVGTQRSGEKAAGAAKAFEGDGSSTGTTGPGTPMTDNSKRFGGLGTDLPGSTGKDRT